MSGAPIPMNEEQRLQALNTYAILDTLPDDTFDRITQLVAEMLNVPVAAINFVDHDRQWGKSCVGVADTTAPRDVSFCAWTILSDDVLIVHNAHEDERFSNNPLVTGAPHIHLYAGAPLITRDGHRLGALCVTDDRPRDFTEKDARFLQRIATMVVDELELRRQTFELEREARVNAELVSQLQEANQRAELLAEKAALAQAEVRAEALRNTQLLERITDAFFAVDTEWRFTYVNPQAERLMQRSAADLLGTDAWTAFPGAVGTIIEENHRRAVAEQRAIGYETYYSPLGSWVEFRAYPSPTGLSVYFRDISERKIAEELDRERNLILEMSVQSKPLPEILTAIALFVERQSPGNVCSIMLQHEGRLYTTAAPSLPAEVSRLIDGIDIAPGVGSCGTAAFTRQSVVVEDLATHEDWVNYRVLALQHGLRACTSLPILSGKGEVLGTFALYSTRPGGVTELELSMLEKARHLAAIVIEHSRLEQRMTYQASHDPLTGLPNRAMFQARLHDELQQADCAGSTLALLFIDLDGFKDVNDAHGHLLGDQLLRQVSERLLGCLRRGDMLARMGGDEFTIILPGVGDAEATQVSERLLGAFTTPFVMDGRELFIGASIGISTFPDAGEDATTLQRHADLAMYQAKTRKSGFATYQPEMTRHAAERLQLTSFLRRAVELAELELHYQPQVNLRTGELTAFEALLRWRHPLLGMVSPAQFIPLAEETGLIVPIGEWVLREACRQGMEWRQQGLTSVRISVNVSALQFERADFVRTVEACLAETGFPAAQLELELTESVVMHDAHESSVRMTQLRDLGVSIAVDDFGTGYSSLSYLPRLPLNVLKIDRSFVKNLGPGSPTHPVVKAITGLAQSLDLVTIAEGIETVEELAIVRELGCDLGQGYHFLKPLPARELTHLLSNKQQCNWLVVT